MRRLLPLVLLAGLGASTLGGCATYGYGGSYPSCHSSSLPALALFAAGVGLAVAASEREHEHEYPPPPEVVTRVVYVNPAPAPVDAPPAVNLPPREHYESPEEKGRPFDAEAARVALHDVDLHACKERGAPAGYGHARITFAPDASVRKVLIDGPRGLSADAVACIGAKLGETQVAPFRGADVSAGFVYRVE